MSTSVPCVVSNESRAPDTNSMQCLYSKRPEGCARVRGCAQTPLCETDRQTDRVLSVFLRVLPRPRRPLAAWHKGICPLSRRSASRGRSESFVRQEIAVTRMAAKGGIPGRLRPPLPRQHVQVCGIGSGKCCMWERLGAPLWIHLRVGARWRQLGAPAPPGQSRLNQASPPALAEPPGGLSPVAIWRQSILRLPRMLRNGLSGFAKLRESLDIRNVANSAV